MPVSSAQQPLPLGFELFWYRITGVLGQGGFGITYQAWDTNLQQSVAIKEYLPKECAQRADTGPDVVAHGLDREALYAWGLDRFKAEAQTLAQFQHPHIVRVMSVFELHNTGYMVMAYEEGEDLARRTKSGHHWREIELLALTRPLLDGLTHLHERGFLHRDIKPANLLLRNSGEPVLLDFGSARAFSLDHTATLTSLLTYGFAPFEQYNQDAGRQGPWTDLYSFGATLYYLITRQKPVDAMSRAIALSQGDPDPQSRLADRQGTGFSPALLAAIDWALTFRAADRPQTVSQWMTALYPATATSGQPDLADSRYDNAVTHCNDTYTQPRRTPLQALCEPSDEATQPPPTSQLTRTAHRRRLSWSLTGLLVLVLMGWIAGLQYDHHQPVSLVASAEDVTPLSASAEQAPGAALPQAAETAPVIERQTEESAPQQRDEPVSNSIDPAAEWLALAERAVQQNRLTRPAQNSAWHYYQRVLTEHPEHPAALTGMRQISRYFSNACEQALRSDDLSTANRHLTTLRRLMPATDPPARCAKALQAWLDSRHARAAELAWQALGTFKNGLEQRDLAAVMAHYPLSADQLAQLDALFIQARAIDVQLSNLSFIAPQYTAYADIQLQIDPFPERQLPADYPFQYPQRIRISFNHDYRMILHDAQDSPIAHSP